MSERPIIFSGPMVCAILAGTKTQTRRVVTAIAGKGRVRELQRSESRGYDLSFRDSSGYWNDMPYTSVEGRSPYGKPGDRLWVRETWAPQPGREDSVDLPECDGGKNGDAVCYKADERPSTDARGGRSHGVRKWRPSIHMPRWASRLTLEVTAVRVERVRDISEADAEAEGVEPDFGNAHTCAGRDYRRTFERMWASINGKRPGASWASNPWVWAVSFRRVEVA